MQQLIDQALTLKIYEDMTRRLYEILGQLSKEKLQMEERIVSLQDKMVKLQQQIEQKNFLIESLMNKFSPFRFTIKKQQDETNPSIKQAKNSIQILQQQQIFYIPQRNSQVCMTKKQIQCQKNESNKLQTLKVDINSYFISLINKKYQQKPKTTQLTELQSKQNIQTCPLSESILKQPIKSKYKQNQNVHLQICMQNQQKQNFPVFNHFRQKNAFISKNQHPKKQIKAMMELQNEEKNQKALKQRRQRNSNFFTQNVKPRKILLHQINDQNIS